nr:uncharacterized protein LOC109178468 [Ipomoea trifida]
MASQSHNTVNQRQPTSCTSGQNFQAERRLSRSEYQHRRARGLCFHCDERWTPTHQCKHLFLLVLDDTMEIDPDAAQDEHHGPEISLHAITGTNSAQTIHVHMEITKCPVKVLQTGSDCRGGGGLRRRIGNYENLY